MSGKITLYKALYKVRVVTEAEGYWIVEALEDFEDCVDNENIVVKKGERRIVSPSILVEQKDLVPTVQEHAYELKMEKKLKKMLDDSELKGNS